jgi:paraquat-inducible protein B
MQGRDLEQRLQKEIESGLRARIKSQGLAGISAIVSLEYVDPKQYPPLKVPWEPRHAYIPSAPGQLTEILASVDKVVTNLKEVDFPKINALVQDDLITGKRVLTNVEKINIQQIATNANALVSDLRSVAQRLKAFAGTPNALTQTNLETISADANALIARLQQTAGHLDQTIGNVDINLLNETLENLRRASRELNETIVNIKEYPAGAILGRPPEPARSVERPKP